MRGIYNVLLVFVIFLLLACDSRDVVPPKIVIEIEEGDYLLNLNSSNNEYRKVKFRLILEGDDYQTKQVKVNTEYDRDYCRLRGFIESIHYVITDDDSTCEITLEVLENTQWRDFVPITFTVDKYKSTKIEYKFPYYRVPSIGYFILEPPVLNKYGDPGILSLRLENSRLKSNQLINFSTTSGVIIKNEYKTDSDGRVSVELSPMEAVENASVIATLEEFPFITAKINFTVR